MKKTNLQILLFALLLCNLTVRSQITVTYAEAKKANYQVGNIINLQVKMKCLPETCLDGMKQSKIFVSGLEIENQTNWKETAKASFQKQLQLRIIPNKKPLAKLTIMRKVDKKSLFYQEQFSIK